MKFENGFGAIAVTQKFASRQLPIRASDTWNISAVDTAIAECSSDAWAAVCALIVTCRYVEKVRDRALDWVS